MNPLARMAELQAEVDRLEAENHKLRVEIKKLIEEQSRPMPKEHRDKLPEYGPDIGSDGEIWQL